jgi:hypothetical protein
MGDLTVDVYFRKIESIVTLLNDLGSTMTDDDVVTYAINGLSEKYANLATIIVHKDPFPDLDTMRLMRGIVPSQKVLPLKGSWEACNPHQAVYLTVVV